MTPPKPKIPFKFIIISIKRISRAPIYRTRWEHRALYNNTNHTHAHTHSASDEGTGTAVKNSLEIIIKQVRQIFRAAHKRGGRIRVAGSLRQTVPNRWASVRKLSFTKIMFLFLHGG